jgi:hypothetical protein
VDRLLAWQMASTGDHRTATVTMRPAYGTTYIEVFLTDKKSLMKNDQFPQVTEGAEGITPDDVDRLIDKALSRWNKAEWDLQK